MSFPGAKRLGERAAGGGQVSLLPNGLLEELSGKRAGTSSGPTPWRRMRAVATGHGRGRNPLSTRTGRPATSRGWAAASISPLEKTWVATSGPFRIEDRNSRGSHALGTLRTAGKTGRTIRHSTIRPLRCLRVGSVQWCRPGCFKDFQVQRISGPSKTVLTRNKRKKERARLQCRSRRIIVRRERQS